ncbi:MULTISPECIES: hypothetical protein [Flavobacterium]|uniref:Uncharacterized protein n=1 Tax=Flavobacterium keumense TaxID=1306518 RepID=A0ABY8N8F4_9FLAO|nr:MULTISPECIES: hypothetical protein [Flavobacterium]WGK94542.1 hypothetical protein MG292_10735 [Flavobacterium keumense]
MAKKLSKFSDQELIKELISRGNHFPTLHSDCTINSPSVFLDLPIQEIVEYTSGDLRVNDEFFTENYLSVFNSLDWDYARDLAFFSVIDYINFTLRRKCVNENSH